MFGPKRTGNWAEDLGNDIGWFFKIGIAAIVLVPVLLFTIFVLVITR